MIDELYIVGDQSRLVVKNIINQFNDCGCDIKVYSPTESQIDNLPNYSIYLLVLLSDNIDFSVITKIYEFLDMHPVDLVLLDYKMPTMDGPAVLEAIRKDERLSNLPVIFLTANNDRQSVINAMQFKPDGYILKSKSPDEIKAAVVDFFKNRIIRM